MPRAKDANQQKVFNCVFMLDRDNYQQFRLLSAQKLISVRELYRQAAEEFIARHQQATAAK